MYPRVVGIKQQWKRSINMWSFIVSEERSEYLSVGVFLESTDMEESKSQLKSVQDDTSKRARRESGAVQFNEF